jgi:putative mRNA 3-end processing factor
MSDHADWPGLLRAIEASGAPRVYATPGYAASLARYLCGQGLDARTFDTREFDAQYSGEQDEPPLAGEGDAPGTAPAAVRDGTGDGTVDGTDA